MPESTFTRKPLIWLIFSILLALIPLGNLTWILATTGTDSISNDYLGFLRLVDKITASDYNWFSYFQDTLYNGVHSYAFLFLVRLLLAKITHLSIYAELYVGGMLHVAKFLLLFCILLRFDMRKTPWMYLALPLLSALVFSNAQISTYSYGETALQMGLIQLFIILALWLLIVKPNHSLTPWVASLFGVLASFSGGAGLMAWPVLLLAILLTGRQDRRKYLAWFIGLLAGTWPYVFFSVYSPFHFVPQYYQYGSIDKFITGLGLPMTNFINFGLLEHNGAYRSGWFGLGLSAVGLLLLGVFHSKQVFRLTIPSLLMIAWGMMNAAQISFSRMLIAPWYASSYMLFWIGLFGLYSTLLFAGLQEISKSKPVQFTRLLQIIAGAAGLLLIAALYLYSNRTYEDKSFYLASRSPASAACLRAYQTAPTYCEGLVFQWGVGNPSYLSNLGRLLQEKGWSVFGPRQEWTMQGDYVLGQVDFPISGARWARSVADQPATWSDYHHLNVLLSTGQIVVWRLDLPEHLNTARFEMGLSPAGNACTPGAFTISAQTPGEAQQTLYQIADLCDRREQNITLDLSAYAGKSLVLGLSNQGGTARMHYPRIQLEQPASALQPPTAVAEPRPRNTDLAADMPVIDSSALRFNGSNGSNWQFQDITIQPNQRMVKSGPLPQVTLAPENTVCRKDWSSIYLKLALSEAFHKRTIRIHYQYRDTGDGLEGSYYDLPILAGEATHTYFLPLDMLKLNEGSCITSLSLQPDSEPGEGPDAWLQLTEIGFLPRKPLVLDSSPP